MNLINKYASILIDKKTPKVRDNRLLMDSMGNISIYYAPFEYINPEAKIVLVGITPGPTQMVNANNVARQVLMTGGSHNEAITKAKAIAAFSGEPMRSNLIKQLNHWGFHKWLGLNCSSSLFSTEQHLLQTTSLLRYPVFVDGNDYRGQPDMTKNTLLRKHLLEYFVNEVVQMKEAIFLSLGPQVDKIMKKLIHEEVLDKNKV